MTLLLEPAASIVTAMLPEIPAQPTLILPEIWWAYPANNWEAFAAGKGEGPPETSTDSHLRGNNKARVT